jgi:hypothetical protein
VLGTKRYPVRPTPKRGLRQVDFVFDGNEIRGLKQNPETKSRGAQMVRSGKKVMQFLKVGRYVADVVGRKLTRYSAARWFSPEFCRRQPLQLPYAHSVSCSPDHPKATITATIQMPLNLTFHARRELPFQVPAKQMDDIPTGHKSSFPRSGAGRPLRISNRVQ